MQVMRWPLLLDAILKATPADHPDYQALNVILGEFTGTQTIFLGDVSMQEAMRALIVK